MEDNAIYKKSTLFAVRVIRLYQYLSDEKKEYVLSKQLLKSGTSIGANVREAIYAQSRKDFTAKMSVALKEAAETEYWIELLKETEYLNDHEESIIMQDCVELKKMLHAIVKTTKPETPDSTV